MQKYLDQLVKEIELRGLAKTTKIAYVRHVQLFLNYHQKDPKSMGLEEIKEFLHHFQKEPARGRKGKKKSPNTVNNVSSALGFFYRHVFDKNYFGEIPRMKGKKSAPTVLSIDEVNLMINSLHNVFWKAIIMTLYTTGMRQSEVRNLKVRDVDSSRMVLYIRESKGAKDRQASLSPALLNCLRQYWQKYRIEKNRHIKSDYLFIPNKNSYNGNLSKCLSHTALGYIVRRAGEIAGIKKKYILIA